MGVSTHSNSRRKPVARRRGHAVHSASRPTAPAVSPGLAATLSAQRGGGPHDSALYQCACGCLFRAPVTTSVGCPACGGGQDW